MLPAYFTHTCAQNSHNGVQQEVRRTDSTFGPPSVECIAHLQIFYLDKLETCNRRLKTRRPAPNITHVDGNEAGLQRLLIWPPASRMQLRRHGTFRWRCNTRALRAYGPDIVESPCPRLLSAEECSDKRQDATVARDALEMPQSVRGNTVGKKKSPPHEYADNARNRERSLFYLFLFSIPSGVNKVH